MEVAPHTKTDEHTNPHRIPRTYIPRSPHYRTENTVTTDFGLVLVAETLKTDDGPNRSVHGKENLKLNTGYYSAERTPVVTINQLVNSEPNIVFVLV